MEKKILWSDRKRTIFGLPISFTKYSLDEERLYIKTGFFNTKEDEVRLYRIMDLSLKQSLGQKIFGVGSIAIFSADKSTGGNFEIKSIKKSKDVKELLSDLVEKQRDAKRITGREYLNEEQEEGFLN